MGRGGGGARLLSRSSLRYRVSGSVIRDANISQHSKLQRVSRAPLKSLLMSGAILILCLALAVPGAKALGPTPSFAVDPASPSTAGLQTPNELARILLGPGVSLASGTEALVNLQTSAQLPTGMAAPCPVATGSSGSPGGPNELCSPLPSFGRFSNGTADLGISSGLLVAANAQAQKFATATPSIVPQNIAKIRAATSPNTDAIALSAVTSAAGLSPTVESATSLSFQLTPPSPGEGRYLKFEYSLLVTEGGTWNNSGPGPWSGDVFDYPDGFALFTGGTADSNNCAVVPGTSTYLSMNTAGIVPPASQFSESRAEAEVRLAARVADTNSPPTTPSGFATSTGELDAGSWTGSSRNANWAVQFLTVPITCVYDASSEIASGSPVSVEIVVANLGDSSVPPAAAFSASSVRWSGTPTPTQEAQLSITRDGSGSGTVTSVPAGIDCGAVCSANFTLNSTVKLSASPASGSSFKGWTGSGCTGTGECEVTMSEARSVTATFDADPPAPAPGPAPGPTPTPSNGFTVRTPLLVGNGIRTLVRVPGAGVIRQAGTFRSGGKVRQACASGATAVSKAGVYRLRCRLTGAARDARRRGSVRVRLVTTYTPTGGTARSVVRTLVLRGLKPTPNFTG